jgi:glycosyltransferase involved in cell wall biosynthesis
MSEQRVLAVFSARLDQAGRAAIARGDWPRKDYFAIVDALGADVIDYAAVERSHLGRLLQRLVGMPRAQALLAFRARDRYDAIFTDGEHIGLPLGLLLRFVDRRPRQVTIGHLLDTRLKRWLIRRLRAGRGIDLFLLHSSLQRTVAQHQLGLPRRKLALLPYQVDPRFWRSEREPDRDDPLVCAAGLEYRDYETLAVAADGLHARVVIAAGSRWSTHASGLRAAALPANLTVTSLDYAALRALYERASCVVVPLRPIGNQAGVTTILEAMAMSRAVIVTATPGQRDVVRGRLCTADGPTGAPFGGPREFGLPDDLATAETGLYVRPYDAAGLRAAIGYLLERPEEARRMGAAGRRLVDEAMNLDRFAAAVASLTVVPGARAAEPAAAQQVATPA